MNTGRVVRVSPDRTKITVALPRGGRMICLNEGFRVGEEVCFVLDPSGRQVERVVPLDVAKVRAMIAADIYLQHAIMEPPEEMVLVDEDQPIFEEDCYADIDDGSKSGDGQDPTINPDWDGGETGRVIEGGEDFDRYPDQFDDPIWFESVRNHDTELT